MTKIEITKTELVWPGKYNEDGALKEVPRVSLPFQVIETVNESRATRETQQTKGMSLFDVYQGNEGDTFEEGWKNKLIWGDNLLVMSSLLKDFAGKIDLIYIDPPFATGADFSFTAPVGNTTEEINKKPSVIEEKAYRDTWGRGRSSWFEMIFDRLRLMRTLLSETGSIYVHLDWYVGHHIRPVLEEVFGEENSLGEIIWGYGSPSGGRVSGSKLVKSHDIIFIFAKRYGQHKYNNVYLPYSKQYITDWFKYTDEDGRLFQKRQRIDKSTGDRFWEKQYLDESKGVPASTVWTDIKQAYADPRAYKLGTTSEITGYATQKPERLLDRILHLSSDPGDLVADFFSGSGTTLSVAEKTGRRWIGCELGRWGTHITRKRLLGIEECKPFEIWNLGKYERQYWQSSAFYRTQQLSDTKQLIYEYYSFVMKLYGAQPVPGLDSLHGKKGKALIHIGPVDAPITITDIDKALNECSHLKQQELHILGWEWEMGLAGPNNDIRRGGLMHDVAKEKGIKLLLFQIPREIMEQQAVDKEDIQFFELAYLETDIRKLGDLSVKVTLKDFVIPNSELIPDDIRDKIIEWSDYIDYWSVDWNFQNDTFIQGWVDYRTRKDRTLRLESNTHTYESPGKYRILVKVIDIFGNDTTQGFDIEVG